MPVTKLYMVIQAAIKTFRVFFNLTLTLTLTLTLAESWIFRLMTQSNSAGRIIESIEFLWILSNFTELIELVIQTLRWIQ